MAFISDVERFRMTEGRMAARLTRCARDTDLTEEQAEKYRPGSVIFHPGLLEAGALVDGMGTTHRFLILSDHMTARREISEGAEVGLRTAVNGRFKVLDVYAYEGRTLITLLHLPDREVWKLFRDQDSRREIDLAREERKLFEPLSGAEPLPALNTETWRRRWAAPVGMDAEGNLFDPEPEGKEALYPVASASFRDFYHRFVYFDRAGAVADAAAKLLEEGDTGVVAYGYFDRYKGLTFRLLAGAALEGRTVVFRKRLDEASVTVRRQDLDREGYLPLPEGYPDLEQFREREFLIRSWFDTRDPALKELREMEELDEWRTPNYPDHVKAFLFRPGQMPEEVWVKPDTIVSGEITGELLSQPEGAFGIHMGGRVPVRIFEKKDGSRCLISFVKDR